MARFNLLPGQSQNIPLSGRFLVAREVSGKVICDDPITLLPEFDFRQGDNIEFPADVRSVRIANRGAVAVVVDVESSPVRIFGNDGGALTITGGQLQRIVEPINVNATAVVENGTVTSQSQTEILDAVDVPIPANSRVQVIAADAAAIRRTVIVQNISATETELRIGGATVAANRGALLTGSKAAPASFEFDTKGAVSVWNNSASAALVAIMIGKV